MHMYRSAQTLPRLLKPGSDRKEEELIHQLVVLFF